MLKLMPSLIHRQIMQASITNINGVPTKVLTWGISLKDAAAAKFKDTSDNYIIFIPGNPGITEFYIEFLEEIHRKTKQPVWIIGNAGHEYDEYFNSHHMPQPEKNKDLYSLQGQIRHKIAFIENYVPTNAKITIIAHSMGTYMALKLLQEPTINSRIVKNYYLFPAIENIAETNNGQFILNFVRYINFAVIPIVTLFNVLPLCIQNFILRMYFKGSAVAEQHRTLIRNFLKPFPVSNFMAVGKDLVLEIRERDNETLKNNIDKIKLYYAVNDNWAPESYYHNIIKDIPGIDAQLCDKGYPHAFVLRHSIPVANMVLEWMKVQ